jgi:hypothetical protein
MKKAPNIYTPVQIKKWDVDEGRRDKFGQMYYQPSRPLHWDSIVIRFKLAWNVFIGKYDALDWHDRDGER